MDNKLSMGCEDVKKKLRLFLDDLLAEDEYKAFCDHIETCDKCNGYVRSIGSLTNQLWKLGKIKVPQDLSSTVMYKVAHPEAEIPSSRFVISKKHIILGSILILSAVAAIFSISYFRNKSLKEKDALPIVKTEIIRTIKPPDDSEAKALLGELETIATGIGASKEQKTIEAEPEKENIGQETKVNKEMASDENRASVSAVQQLHWHFRYSKQIEAKLLEALHSAGIVTDYQKQNIIVFSATGKKAEQVLAGIISNLEEKSSFQDFTANTPTIADKEYRVSCYLEDQQAGALHWHIGAGMPAKRGNLLDIIKEYSSSFDYDSDELVIVTIADTDVDALRQKIQAARVPFAEYGPKESKKGTLSSGPRTISIYFMK